MTSPGRGLPGFSPESETPVWEMATDLLCRASQALPCSSFNWLLEEAYGLFSVGLTSPLGKGRERSS